MSKHARLLMGLAVALLLAVGVSIGADSAVADSSYCWDGYFIDNPPDCLSGCSGTCGCVMCECGPVIC